MVIKNDVVCKTTKNVSENYVQAYSKEEHTIAVLSYEL